MRSWTLCFGRGCSSTPASERLGTIAVGLFLMFPVRNFLFTGTVRVLAHTSRRFDTRLFLRSDAKQADVGPAVATPLVPLEGWDGSPAGFCGFARQQSPASADRLINRRIG